MKVRDLLKQLHADGWYLARQTGSHRQFRHPESLALLPFQVIRLMSFIPRRFRVF
jgi:predicted RNA binding protein YcfA (HicA-like mRNA interferase family)